jgi:hypothetical protein
LLVNASWRDPRRSRRTTNKQQPIYRRWDIFLHNVHSGAETSVEPVLRRLNIQRQAPVLDSFALSPDGQKILWQDPDKKEGLFALVTGKVLCRWPHGEKANFSWLPDSQRFRVVRWFNHYAAEAITYNIDGKVVDRVLLRSLPRQSKVKVPHQGFTILKRYTSPFSISPDIVVADTMTGHYTWERYSTPDVEQKLQLFTWDLRKRQGNTVYPSEKTVHFPRGVKFLNRSYSPNGTYISYKFLPSQGRTSPEREWMTGVWISHIDGSAMRLLISGIVPTPSSNPWLPDGRTVSYWDWGTKVLYTVAIHGDTRQPTLQQHSPYNHISHGLPQSIIARMQALSVCHSE